MPSFKKVLRSVAEGWQKRPDDVAQIADQMARALEATTARGPSRPGQLDESVLSGAVAQLGQQFDAAWGGFGGAPKFPPTGAIKLLLRQQGHADQDDLLRMATVTLDRMAYGGIHDQLGGGFHRYSVDARWLVPHFEKMLYDNALLSKVYLEAWQATHKDLYRRVAAGVLDYVLRDMTDRRGGFHSAEDADSEGEEGRFYVWGRDQINAVLGDEDAALFCRYYGVSDEGNFEGRNILNVPHDPATFSLTNGMSEKELEDRLTPLRRKLLAEREKRVRPGKDDKVLAAWNGMTISALARGYQVLGDDRYLNAAQRAADFILTEMVRDGVLLRTYRGVGPGEDGVSKLPGYLDDYAQVAGGLIDLYEASFDRRWLEAADQLAGKMLDDFWDPRHAGFFYTSEAHQNLLVRTKPLYDAAVPSGNSTATLVLLRLWKLLDNEQYLTRAEAVLASAADTMRSQPQAHLDLLCALDFHLHPTSEIAIAGTADGDDTRSFLEIIHGRFLPNKVLALVEPDAADAEPTEKLVPLLSGKKMISGKATVYVCENFACRQPVSDAVALRKILEGLR